MPDQTKPTQKMVLPTGKEPGLSLPYIRKETDITALPFVKDTGEGRCFWSVDPTGDYKADYRTGKVYAAIALDYLRINCFTIFITWIVRDMLKQKASKNGIIEGFFFFIGEYAWQHPLTPREVFARHEIELQETRGLIL